MGDLCSLSLDLGSQLCCGGAQHRKPGSGLWVLILPLGCTLTSQIHCCATAALNYGHKKHTPRPGGPLADIP